MTDSTTTSWLHLKPGTFTVNTVRNVLTQPFAFELLLQSLVKAMDSNTNKSLALVLLGQGWSHYSAVASKCGMSTLKGRLEEGTITVVDVFDENDTFFDQSHQLNWTKLIAAIESQVSSLPNHSALLLDDLSVLLSYDIEPASIYRFIRRLRQSLKQKSCSLFVGTYLLEEDEVAASLVTSLLYECDTWLDCDRPKSGYSQTINGIARCTTFNRQQQADGNSTEVIEMNYKLANRNVVFKRI